MDRLWSDASEIQTALRDSEPFEHYVGADFQQVFDALLSFQGRRLRFLEWGSGLGVATIMASRMGLEAYGIEIESELVKHARTLGKTYGSDAKFFAGSFVPDLHQPQQEQGSEYVHTDTQSPSVYEEIGLAISDFDLIYAYPWPNEHSLYHDVMRQFQGPNAVLLTFDEELGVQEFRFGH